jgi:hypothetical protein
MARKQSQSTARLNERSGDVSPTVAVSANPYHRIDIASPCLFAGASHNSDKEGVRSRTRERGELSKPSPATDCIAPLP